MSIYKNLLNAFAIEEDANAVTALAGLFCGSCRQHATASLATDLIGGLFKRDGGGCRKLRGLIDLVKKI
ncbi:MAG: hypothetical protein OES38_02685, partial [Gammaproteobacteria bacterium]|nr:hypothetical protein [Gammaproteobacteria bacterium]